MFMFRFLVILGYMFRYIYNVYIFFLYKKLISNKLIRNLFLEILEGCYVNFNICDILFFSV